MALDSYHMINYLTHQNKQLMLTPEPSPINWQPFLGFLIIYIIWIYFGIKYFSNKNTDNAKDL